MLVSVRRVGKSIKERFSKRRHQPPFRPIASVIFQERQVYVKAVGEAGGHDSFSTHPAFAVLASGKRLRPPDLSVGNRRDRNKREQAFSGHRPGEQFHAEKKGVTHDE